MSTLDWTPTRHALLQLCREERVEFAPTRYGTDAAGISTGLPWGIDGHAVIDPGTDEALDELMGHRLTHECDSQEITDDGLAVLDLWDSVHGTAGAS